MRLYLAGAMRGVDEFNFPAFRVAAERLRSDGHEILSPAEHDIDSNPGWDPQSNDLEGLDLLGALAWDLTQILDEKTEGVALLPGWQQSHGAQVEARLARMLGKPVFEYIDGYLHGVVWPFETKDSGRRVEFDSGMCRDVDEGKPRYDLIPLGPLRRLADLYARGAQKYGDENWTLANSPEELQRFKASAFRHFVQWLGGEQDEDHGIAACWNIFAVLHLEQHKADQ